MERGLIEQWRDRGQSPDELAAEMNGVATRLLEIALRLPAAPDQEEDEMSEPPPIDEHNEIEEVESDGIRRLGTPLRNDRLGDIALLVPASFDRAIVLSGRSAAADRAVLFRSRAGAVFPRRGRRHSCGRS
jgi:hypothetical protein